MKIYPIIKNNIYKYSKPIQRRIKKAFHDEPPIGLLPRSWKKCPSTGMTTSELIWQIISHI